MRNDNERAVTVEVRDDQGERVTAVTMTVTGETVTIKIARAVASDARVRNRPRNFA